MPFEQIHSPRARARGTAVTAFAAVLVCACLAPSTLLAQPRSTIEIASNGLPMTLTTAPPVLANRITFVSQVDAFLEFPSNLTEDEARARARGLPVLLSEQPDATWMVPARCVAQSTGICVRMDLPAGSKRTVSLAVFASFSTSTIINVAAYRRDGLFFERNTGSIRLVPEGHHLLRVRAGAVSMLAEKADAPLCTAPEPPRTCAALTILRIDQEPNGLQIQARDVSTAPALTQGVYYVRECLQPSWGACLHVDLTSAEVPVIRAADAEQTIALPLRAVPAKVGVPLPPSPPPPAVPPGQLTPARTRGAGSSVKPSRPIYITVSREGELEAALRNPKGRLPIAPSRDLIVRNNGEIDVQVEIQVPSALVVRAPATSEDITLSPCGEGNAYRCIRTTIVRDRIVEIPALLFAVVETTDNASIVVRRIPQLSVTSDGFLRIEADPSLVRVPPPPPATTIPAERRPEPTATATARKPPTSTLDFLGDFSYNRLADFDTDNDGQDVISGADPFDGGYANALRGKASLQLKRTDDTLEGSVSLVFQDSFFGGLDGRLLPGPGQSTLVKTAPASRIDDPVSVDAWFVKVAPYGSWFFEVGRLSFATTPDNIAGVEGGEGLRFSLIPDRKKALSVSAGYSVMREGLNGVPDRHERDADVFGVDASWETSRHDVLAYPPSLGFVFRHTWDRGRDEGSSDSTLTFDSATHPFFGTQKRRTLGFTISQPLPRKFEARFAWYASRLRGDDVAATVAKQEGKGHVLRTAVHTPKVTGLGSFTAFFLRGSRDDEGTPLVNEGFLGNEQRRFAERGSAELPDSDSIYFHRMTTVMQVRQVGNALVPAFGLANKTYAGVSWNGELTIEKAKADWTPEQIAAATKSNPLRNLLWVVKYRAIHHRGVGDASGFAGHELAFRLTGKAATGNGTWAPYAGVVFFRPADALDGLVKENVLQAFLGASIKIPLFSRSGNP